MSGFASLTNKDDGYELTCEFNPSTVKLVKTSTWSTPPVPHAKEHPRPQFIGTGPQTMSLNLLFNAFDRYGSPAAAPVDEAVQHLLDWTKPTQKSQDAHKPLPPTIEFSWGDQLTITGFLARVEIDYLLFDNQGKPLRATAAVQIQTLPADVKPTNPTSGGITGRRSAQTSEADSLASIAQREYGDPGLWRAIAIANDIDDPGRVPPGTRLLLPPRTQAFALAAVGGDPR
jgi:hypothetical protein